MPNLHLCHQSFLPNLKVYIYIKLLLLNLVLFHLCCFLSDLFEDLVPISVQQALSAYDVRKTELVNSEIGKLRESTQILNGYVILSYNGYLFILDESK